MKQTLTPQGHLHGEAFMRMPYDCRACGQREWLWNSRDGVTPFIIGCKACGGDAQHGSWHKDQYVPDYKPEPGERYFADMTPASALEAAQQMMARSDGTPYERQGAEREEVIASMVADFSRPGEPDILTAGV